MAPSRTSPLILAMTLVTADVAWLEGVDKGSLLRSPNFFLSYLHLQRVEDDRRTQGCSAIFLQHRLAS